MKVLLVLILVVASSAFAHVVKPITGTLDNGLDYAILPLHTDKGRTEIRLLVHAGAVDETNTQAGVAHMVEHLVFRASDKHPDGVMNHLHGLGFVRAKHYNAVTTAEHTTYMMTPPAHVGLDGGLSALSQMMFFAHLTADDLGKERQIITEEWRDKQGISAHMDEQRKAVIRADSRYVRSPVIGTYQSIQSMPAHELQHFYRTWYTPNNMNLLIVGDVDVQATKDKIHEYFGQIPTKTLPDRTGDYYDVKLSDRLIIKELHHDKSGVSQVAYIVRFDESHSRGTSDIAHKNRLIDRLALTHLTKRLQNQTPTLPQGIKSMVVRKSDIGKNTVALGIFSSVDKDKHMAGLQEIFYEIKRLSDYPISQAEFNALIKELQAQLDKAHANDGRRDFTSWVQALNNTVLMDKPYHTQRELATRLQPLLDELTADEIQARINTWLVAQDRIVQYQTPHTTRIAPISTPQIHAMMTKAQNATLSPPTPKAIISPKEPPHAITHAHITNIKTHTTTQGDVYEYTLSTGERVLYLHSPHAQDKTYIRMTNPAGTQAMGLNAWQSQLAYQLIFQDTPDGLSKDELSQLKKTHKLSLSAKQNSHELVVEMSSPNDSLDKLINLYHAQMYHTTIKGELTTTKTALAHTINDDKYQHIAKLRGLPLSLPSLDELTALSPAMLQDTWTKMTQTPATFYVVSHADPAWLGQFIVKLANPHPNLRPLSHAPTSLAPTNLIKSHHSQPKADVKLWVSTSHTWQGVDAMLVNLLANIASEKLKLTLRDEKLGIYRLKFDSTLSPYSHRIDSQLSFSTDPDRADEMTQDAKRVLENLPQLIGDDDVKKAKAHFHAQHQAQRSDPHALLNRLALSDKQQNHLSYLNQINDLDKHITLDNLTKMASKMYNKDSVQIWIDTPSP